MMCLGRRLLFRGGWGVVSGVVCFRCLSSTTVLLLLADLAWDDVSRFDQNNCFVM